MATYQELVAQKHALEAQIEEARTQRSSMRKCVIQKKAALDR